MPAAEEGVPYRGGPSDGKHQAAIFAALDAVPEVSLEYLRRVADSGAARLADLIGRFFAGRDAQRQAAAAAVALVVHDPDGSRAAGLRSAGYEEGELRSAATEGDLARARALLALGLNPDTAAEALADWCPLQYAAQQGHSAVCVALADHGAEVFASDRNGETALMQAAYWGHTETVVELTQLEERALAAGATHQRSHVPPCVVLHESPVPWGLAEHRHDPLLRARVQRVWRRGYGRALLGVRRLQRALEVRLRLGRQHDGRARRQEPGPCRVRLLPLAGVHDWPGPGRMRCPRAPGPRPS